MALELALTRIAKSLVESEGISFDEAQARLRQLSLEIVVGENATTLTAHAAILTAVSVGSRTFIGGVRIAGYTSQPLNSSFPLRARMLDAAALEVGASDFDGAASHRIIIGSSGAAQPGDIWTGWQGWQCAAAPYSLDCDNGDNPLTGIAAGALAVSVAFNTARNLNSSDRAEVNLWPTVEGEAAPNFTEIFLPGALWIVGLGNLGQAYVWALSSLPYSDPSQVTLVIQDRDRVTEENWATSVLVRQEVYGALKTKVAETWGLSCGFDVRRIDRRLLSSDRLDRDEPRVALCGVDKINVRAGMADIGFECIVDAGLGRTADDFDRYRVTVFDVERPINKHFEGSHDTMPIGRVPEEDAYKVLEKEIGNCGAVEIAGASVATAFVSAIAAAVVVTRAIAVVSGYSFPSNEVNRLSTKKLRRGPVAANLYRQVRHAGRPRIQP
ncbi:MAG: hypothetical protein KA312_05575 [Sphingorhabdus sp.]|nr:hypothetical protein [Sphingorhabdus sp.]